MAATIKISGSRWTDQGSRSYHWDSNKELFFCADDSRYYSVISRTENTCVVAAI